MNSLAKKLMKFKSFNFACIIILIAQMSCTQNKSAQVNDVLDFDSLLESQIKLLNASKAELNKTAIVNDSTEKLISTPKDSAAWANELEIFMQMSALNKPATRQNYTVQEVEDDKSNLQVMVIRAIEDLPLQQVKIFFLNNKKNIRRIEAQLNEKNMLYNSARMLSMSFNEVNNKLMLTAYSITGGQHMIVGDTLSFSVYATITIPN